jgi:hypothetical protein
VNARTVTVALSVGLAVVLLVGAGLWVTRGTQATADGASPGPTASPVAASPSGTPSGCHLERGQGFAFAYRSETHSRISAQLPGASEVITQAATVELTGTLSFEVLSAGERDAVLLGRLSGVNAPATRAAGPTLEAGFLLRVDEQCQVTAFARHQQTPQVAARAQHVVVTDLSFATADGAAPREVVFPTSLGTLRALVLPGDAPGTLVRRALAYTAHWAPRMAAVQLVEGDVEVRRGASRWFEGLRGVEVVAGGEVQTSKTEWSLAAQPYDATALAGVTREVGDYVWENSLGVVEGGEVVVGTEAEDHARRVATMRDVSFDAALLRFGAKLEAGVNINEQWRDMAAWLDAHPERITDYVEVITDEAFPAGGKAPAFLALGQTQNPVAREALLGVFREPDFQQGDRIRSSLALSMRTDVGLPLAKELKAVAAQGGGSDSEAAVARQAVLHLGVLAGTHRAQPDVVAESLSLVSALAGSAKTADDYSVLFGLVGNMGEPSLLPRIADWSRSPDPVLRRELPDAIRRYRVERVHDLVLEWLQRETDADVKRGLFDTLYHMYVDAGRPVEEDLMREALRHLDEQPLPLTRQSLYHLLTPHAHRPEVKAALTAGLRLELAEKSGLYALVAQALPRESIYEALRVDVRSSDTPAAAPAATPGRPLNEAAPPGFDAIMQQALRAAEGERAP